MRRRYTVSVYAHGLPATLSRAYTRRRDAETAARQAAARQRGVWDRVEVWVDMETRVRGTATGTAHAMILAIRP